MWKMYVNGLWYNKQSCIPEVVATNEAIQIMVVTIVILVWQLRMWAQLRVITLGRLSERILALGYISCMDALADSSSGSLDLSIAVSRSEDSWICPLLIQGVPLQVRG